MTTTATSLLPPSSSLRSSKSPTVVLGGRTESSESLSGVNSRQLVGGGARSTDPAVVSTRVGKRSTKLVDDAWRTIGNGGASADELAGCRSLGIDDGQTAVAEANATVNEFVDAEGAEQVEADVPVDTKLPSLRSESGIDIPPDSPPLPEPRDTTQSRRMKLNEYEVSGLNELEDGPSSATTGNGEEIDLSTRLQKAGSNEKAVGPSFSADDACRSPAPSGTVTMRLTSAPRPDSADVLPLHMFERRKRRITTDFGSDNIPFVNPCWLLSISATLSNPLFDSTNDAQAETWTEGNVQTQSVSSPSTSLTSDALAILAVMLVDIISVAVRTGVLVSFYDRLRQQLRQWRRRRHRQLKSAASAGMNGLHLSAFAPPQGVPMTVEEEYATTSRQNVQRNQKGSCLVSPRRKSAAAEGVVVGLRNYGQTCFLNSVLQALASLPPFVAYLERIVELHRDRLVLGGTDETQDDDGDDYELATPSASLWGREISDFIGRVVKPRRSQVPRKVFNRSWSGDPELLSEILLETLKSVNGVTAMSHDPRELLQRVGSRNAQFQSRHGGVSHIGTEQQDAHELLQALLSLVILDSELDSDRTDKPETGTGTTEEEEQRRRILAPSSLRTSLSCTSFTDFSVTDSEAAVARLGDRPDDATSLKTNDYSERDDMENDSVASSNGGEAMLLSSFLHRMDEFHRLRKEQESNSFEKACVATRDSSSVVWKEEKKQDAEDLVVSWNRDVKAGGETSISNGGTEHISPPQVTVKEGTSSKRAESEMTHSPLTQTMLRGLSPIAPSPLTGWVGSTLQCSTCGHIRPIQNAPFLEIPIVPTSLSDLTMPGRHAGCHQQACQALPACSLKQCLRNFTAVERVQDVECRNCTLKAELRGVEEEAETVALALETLMRRKAGSRGNDLDGLKRELAMLESRREKILKKDPDSDEWDVGNTSSPEDSHAVDDCGLLYDNIFATNTTCEGALQRGDANKCLLLTRLPTVLCLHVQRRYLDPVSNCMAKAMQHVDFPETMDFGPYCAYGGGTNAKTTDKQSWVGKGASATSQPPPSPMMYRLMSVIEHKGNAFSGHYETYRRRGLSSSTSEKKEWARVSDESVSYITWNEVRKCQAYMLFYEAVQ